MKTITATSRLWRALLVIPISVVAVLSIVATGGSSGGGDDGFDGDVPGTVQLTAASFDATEGTIVNIIVTRTDGSSGAASVSYATEDGSAVAGSDYEGQSGTLSWPDGVAGNQTISIRIIDDSVEELAESFTVTLSNVSGATLGANSIATVNIFDDGDEPPIILSSYNFEIGSTDSTVDVPLTVSVGSLGELAVNFGNTILGRINLDVSTTGDVTLLSTVTDAGSTFSLSASISEPALSAGAAVTVTQDINADAFDVPTSGAFEITTTPPIGTITVTILDTMEVEIRLDDGAPSTYSFEEFTELVANPSAQEYEVVASLAVLAYEFLFERVFEVADVLDELEDVALIGDIVEQCDMFRAAPPVGVLPQGQVTLTMTGPVVYQANFSDCWADAPFDTLLRGVIQLSNYIEEVDASNRLTRIGFGPDASTRGGVEFLNFRIDEAAEVEGVFVIDPSSSIEVNGGFSLVFAAP